MQFSPRYLLVEALTGLLSAIICWSSWWRRPTWRAGGAAARYALYFAFAGVLVVLSFIDLDTKRLPDVITLPSIPIFFLAGFAAHDVPWLERAIGAAAGYLLVRIISDGYYYLTGREGLGLGDGKLLAVVGAVLGWRAIPFTIFLASFLGIAVSVPILLHRRRNQPPPPPEFKPEPTERSARGRSPHTDRSSAPSFSAAPEVPFGPFLSLSAIVYMLAGPRSGSGSRAGWPAASYSSCRPQSEQAPATSGAAVPQAGQGACSVSSSVDGAGRPGASSMLGGPLAGQQVLPALIQQVGHPLDVLLGHQQLHAGSAAAAALAATGAALQVGGDVRLRAGGLQLAGVGQRRGEAGDQLPLDVEVLFHVPNVTPRRRGVVAVGGRCGVRATAGVHAGRPADPETQETRASRAVLDGRHGVRLGRARARI